MSHFGLWTQCEKENQAKSTVGKRNKKAPICELGGDSVVAEAVFNLHILYSVHKISRAGKVNPFYLNMEVNTLVSVSVIGGADI